LSRNTVTELTRFFLLLGLSAFIGSLFGAAQLFALFTSIGISLFHIVRITRLEEWMGSSQREVPEANGIWGKIYDHLHRNQKRNHAQKKTLAAALSRFRQITAALPDGVVILQRDHIIDWCNDSSKRLLGIRTPHDIGQPITNLIRIPAFSKYLKKNEFNETLQIRSPENEFISLSIRIVPYGKDQSLMLARDMTKINRLEQARKDFVANASHELRTPLTVVNGYLEALAEDDSEELKRYSMPIQAMREQTLRMQNIVEDLLVLSRLENSATFNDTEKVDIAALLNEVYLETQKLAKEKNQIVSLNSDVKHLVLGNHGELYSAISNLAFNAVRYTPVGGKVSLSCRDAIDGIKISVEDSGIGIAPQHIPRLTERFYRIDTGRSRETGGTGLGLAIVKHVLMRHNARLEIESNVGKGSKFTVFFPESQFLNDSDDVTKMS